MAAGEGASPLDRADAARQEPAGRQSPRAAGRTDEEPAGRPGQPPAPEPTRQPAPGLPGQAALERAGQAALGLADEVARGVRERLRDALGTRDERTPDESRAWGRSLRAQVPRSAHAAWDPPDDRPDPVALLAEQGQGRLQELLPLRYERMAASSFAFFRGAALLMASDLSRTPTTGITVQASGDAHIANFGLFNSPERRTVFGLNDFDETLPGPWEWDVKRLAASVEVCCRGRGFAAEERECAVLASVRAYREGMRSFARMGHLDVWYSHLDMDSLMESLELDGDAAGERSQVRATARALERAKRKDSGRAVAKLTEVADGRLRFVSEPPTLVPLRDIVAQAGHGGTSLDGKALTEAIGRVLAGYRLSLPAATRRLVEHYEGLDIARKVVGVGSVGTRCWVVVMRGASDDDALVLQIKEAQESVLERFVGKSAYREHGQRVVEGQRAMQTAGDLLLGWCRLPDVEGRPRDYYVRQLWDGKGGADLDRLPADAMASLARACGWTLAHAHARTGDRFAIASYLGKGEAFDRAVASFARSYADQNEADYARFLDALDSGELPGAAPRADADPAPAPHAPTRD